MRLLVLFLLAAASALGDGGTVQLRRETGPFVVTVFTDLSVMVQDRTGLQPVLDAQVSLQSNNSNAIQETHSQAQNKLLYAAPLPPNRGTGKYTVIIKRGNSEAAVSGVLNAEVRPEGTWPYVALAPILIGLFALRERLVHNRKLNS